MADLEIPISGLPTASLPLSGAEKVPMVQDGVTVEASTQAIADLGVSAFKQTITCDGTVDLYTITHNKNNYAPSVSVWFLDTGNSIWQPLDVTQGITGSMSDPNVIYFNPMVYMGNSNGFIYKLTIPA